MTTKTTPSRLREAILETTDDMRRLGIMDEATHQKITMRRLGKDIPLEPAPISGDEIRGLRERARLSQAVFARHLNLTAGYVSQLERGAKRPTGPALVLLDLIRRKGMDAIL
ncbi:helix-turn-helix domain-containing protein [Rhodoblastus sp.]|uniref:helix-turn-helix domain-containing protein n=1 Tax=Rhodoblastus sp. TaxID=1962975 RepID=UPI003F9828B7